MYNTSVLKKNHVVYDVYIICIVILLKQITSSVIQLHATLVLV